MINAWPNVEEIAWAQNLKNKDSKEIKNRVLEYNPENPCCVFNIEKGRYWHWVALTPQFYNNDAIYYKVTNFSAAARVLSLIEKAPGKPNSGDVERHFLRHWMKFFSQS